MSSIEKKIVRRVYKALAEAGTPVVAVFDGEERVKCSSIDEVIDAVFAVDYSTLLTESGAGVAIVLGNEWDALSDYNMSLEPALAPVNAWIDANND